MSAIFKERKIPRHLIIYDDYDLKARPLRNRSRLLLWSLAIAGVVLIIGTVSGVWQAGL